jgi:hypothetical protein
MTFYGDEFLPLRNTHGGGPLYVDSLQMLVHYNSSYLPYVEAVAAIRSLFHID